jgi:hypothetical protein|tara:strand:+ start:229 stop:411 length:183 start_codon:yes stop_codon:yes gene_type:complete
MSKEREMKRFDSTVGTVTTKEKAQEIADAWRNPKLGFHTQVIRKNFGYICRVVINALGTK